MSNHSRERATRVTLAVILIATAVIASLASVLTSMALVPALALTVVCGGAAVGLVYQQMIDDRRRDARARAQAASDHRNAAVAASQDNMVFVRTMHDQLRAGR